VSRRLDWRRRALADLADIVRRDVRTARRVRDAVTQYAEDDLGDVRKLMGSGDEYRLRIGDWRVIFTLEDGDRNMVIVRVVNRRDAYR